jgi:hypothetical protein
MSDDFEFSSEEESGETLGLGELGASVLWGTDWTVETMIAQLKRGNIELNPRFQRRDAWSKGTKSRFIESLILGLPIPQIVLAEAKEQRGKYIILDGKQRLLTLMQFAGLSDGEGKAFSLSGLEVRRDLTRKKYINLETDPQLSADYDALLTHTVRTTVIRNWPSVAFLHIVFQRLNTGSLKLSPQELRQAVVPGPFTDHADDASLASGVMHSLLGGNGPDPRMRDVELLVRFLGFRLSLREYTGRMKSFLDNVCAKFNKEWASSKHRVVQETEQFELAVAALNEIFGSEGVARKQGSRLFNRSIFDVLSYYAAEPNLRTAMKANPNAVRSAYAELTDNQDFREAVESDTAGMPHTVSRFQLWGGILGRSLGVPINIPQVAFNVDGELRFVS